MSHEYLWEQLIGLDGFKTAQRAKCQYISNPARYIVSLLNNEYVVALADKQIFSVRDSLKVKDADFLQQLCILSYLINSTELPLANKLVGVERLPGGQFFFRGIHKVPTEKLVKTFGSRPEILHHIAGQFNARICEFGDASIEFYVLPRIPLTIVVWKDNEEFEARASVLFDQTAANHLPLDALWAAVNLSIDALVKAAESGS